MVISMLFWSDAKFGVQKLPPASSFKEQTTDGNQTKERGLPELEGTSTVSAFLGQSLTLASGCKATLNYWVAGKELNSNFYSMDLW